MKFFNKEWARFVWSDPFYWVEVLFRLVGLILMFIGLLANPFNRAYFFTGLFSYAYSLFIRKRRIDNYKTIFKTHVK
jgi:succinate dehydrogenase/fumarate reductase cytochrome b subunit